MWQTRAEMLANQVGRLNPSQERPFFRDSEGWAAEPTQNVIRGVQWPSLVAATMGYWAAGRASRDGRLCQCGAVPGLPGRYLNSWPRRAPRYGVVRLLVKWQVRLLDRTFTIDSERFVPICHEQSLIGDRAARSPPASTRQAAPQAVRDAVKTAAARALVALLVTRYGLT